MSAADLGYVEVDGYQGMALVVSGHGLSNEVVAAHSKDLSEDGEPRSEEVYWTRKRRVKWCSRHGDGWGCDEEGEWHAHWFEVRPNENIDTHFTAIWTTS